MELPPQRAAYDALDKSIRIFSEKVALAKPSAFLPKGRKLLAKMAPPIGSLADCDARRLAGRYMIDELLNHHQRTKKKGYRHFLVTFCWDAGVLLPVPPFEFDLQAMQIKAYKAIKKVDVSGVGVFEAMALCKGKFNPEQLAIHLHAVCWTRDRSFKPERWAKRLQNSFRNSLGAPSVSIQSRQKAATRFRNKKSTQYRHLFSKLGKDQTKASMAWLGYYLFQAPAWAHQIVPRKQRADALAMRSTSQKYPSQLALALDGLLSSIDIMDAVFSVGEGKAILTPWRRQFRKAFSDRDALRKGRKKTAKLAVRKRRARLLKRIGRTDEQVEN
jgi:hypothetical protein